MKKCANRLISLTKARWGLTAVIVAVCEFHVLLSQAVSERIAVLMVMFVTYSCQLDKWIHDETENLLHQA